jgi:hypothetical protein
MSFLLDKADLVKYEDKRRRADIALHALIMALKADYARRSIRKIDSPANTSSRTLDGFGVACGSAVTQIGDHLSGRRGCDGTIG